MQPFAERRTALLQEAGLVGPAFCRAYTAAVDDWLRSLVGDVDDIALVAVGGYGRAELCPGSDLDLLLLHGKRTPVGDLADRIWYPVWDAAIGLDHSVRTPKEVLALAASDLKTATGLLDGRVVAGDASLAEPVVERVRQEWVEHSRRWLPVLADAVEDRHRSFGEVAFLLEPDLKESKGGLRDVTALRAAALAAPDLVAPDDAAARGTAAWLLTVRIELHRQSGRGSDVLLLQEQDAVAATLGEPDADRLMAKVADAGRTVAWRSDDTWRRARDRAGRRRPGVAEVTLGPSDDLGEPATVLRVAAAAARRGAPFARDALDRLASEAAIPQLPWPAEARDAFVELLGAGRAAIPVLEALDQKGLLVRLLPEWAPVRSRPQRNAYHRFTVDRHLWEATANASEARDRVARPDLLLLGTLFHDIGKGYEGDHTAAGMTVVRRLGERLGLPAADIDVLVAMVEHHLLLPDVATRRDLDDPTTIGSVAAAIGSHHLLHLLHALTEADSLATGPSAWSDWKAALVTELVERVEAVLDGGTPAGTPSFPTPEHRRLMRGRAVSLHVDGDELTVVAPDRPGLLARVTGVLALHGLDVRAASIAGEDGMAVEVFTVDGAAADLDRDRLARDLDRAVRGRLALEARLADRVRAYGSLRRAVAAEPARTSVSFDNDASTSATVIEVRAPDAPGVLHRITRALAECDLDVLSAKVTTLGHEVLDAFYVRDADGGKLHDAEYRGEIQRAVVAELSR